NIEVSEEEIVKGYEYEPGHFVVLKDEDFKAIQGKSGPKNIEILDFVKLSEIDPVYFNKTYYLAPQDIDGKAYNLLRRAMDQTGKIAIARVAIRNRQTLAAIRVYRDALVMETLFYADEVRPSEQIPNLPRNTDADEKELDIAVKLIDSLTVEFKPEKYTNEYRTVLSELISRKIEGEEIRVAPTVPKSNVIDLMEALKASLQETKKKTGRKSAQPKKKKAGKAV
ncbi:MAG TPA: Ku protein, partial [Ruminiclostridium sp.]|nr:Ku protein [Ruminiclostridium sp.]